MFCIAQGVLIRRNTVNNFLKKKDPDLPTYRILDQNTDIFVEGPL